MSKRYRRRWFSCLIIVVDFHDMLNNQQHQQCPRGRKMTTRDVDGNRCQDDLQGVFGPTFLDRQVVNKDSGFPRRHLNFNDDVPDGI